MRIRKSHAVIAGIVAAIAVPLLFMSAASAETVAGEPQSPTQGLDAGLATLQNANESFLDAVNGADRPAGADGTDTQFPPFGPGLVDGPLAGLLQNGPLE